MSIQHWWNTGSDAIPMFRTSRTAKPIQFFNLQWADTPEHIEQTLSSNGWQPLPKLTLTAAIYSITDDEKDRQLPFVPRAYSGKRPIIVMIKTTDTDNILLVLRLWQSNIVFKDSTLPLLLGTINYQLPRRHHFWQHKDNKRRKQALLPATDQLMPVIAAKPVHGVIGFNWHRVIFPMSLRPKTISSHNEWRGGVLYIRRSNWKAYQVDPQG